MPTGHDLFALPVGEFRAYVAGIVEEQRLLADGLNVPQAVCVGPMMTRIELASLVLYAISRLPGDFLKQPARVVVFRALMENTPCARALRGTQRRSADDSTLRARDVR